MIWSLLKVIFAVIFRWWHLILRFKFFCWLLWGCLTDNLLSSSWLCIVIVHTTRVSILFILRMLMLRYRVDRICILATRVQYWLVSLYLISHILVTITVQAQSTGLLTCLLLIANFIYYHILNNLQLFDWQTHFTSLFQLFIRFLYSQNFHFFSLFVVLRFLEQQDLLLVPIIKLERLQIWPFYCGLEALPPLLKLCAW